MSIVTLKKKTAAKYHNNSCNVPQFSLNCTRRSQGYIGQDTLGRSLPRTIMKGITPKGSGGCCGKYFIAPIVQSAVTSVNNSKVVKPSVVGTTGLIMTKYRWIRRPQPFSVTKPGASFSQGSFTQQMYITNLAKDTLNYADKSSCQRPTLKPTVCKSDIFSSDRNSHLSNVASKCLKLTKDMTDPIAVPKYRIAMTQGQYIQKLDSNCGKFNEKFALKKRGAPTFGHC